MKYLLPAAVLSALAVLCFTALLATTDRAAAQTLPTYACVQNVSNAEFLTSKASQLADNCQGQQVWKLTKQSNNYYCIQNVSSLEYLESHATQMSSTCGGNARWSLNGSWSNGGMATTCIQNVSTEEYLTNKASSMASECNSKNQYWTISVAPYQDLAPN